MFVKLVVVFVVAQVALGEKIAEGRFKRSGDDCDMSQANKCMASVNTSLTGEELCKEAKTFLDCLRAADCSSLIQHIIPTLGGALIQELSKCNLPVPIMHM